VFDFRYHALSLVAVFIALALGLLLGVAIGDSGLVSNAERDIRSGLRRDVRRANERADDAQRAREQAEREVDATYPLLVGGQLANRSVGLVFLGNGSQDLSDDVKSALDDTGATRVNVATIKEPLDLGALARNAKGTRYDGMPGTAGAPDLDLVEAFGFRMAAQYVLPGKLIARERDDLFDRLAGTLKPLQGVVLVRNPDDDLSDDERAIVTRFETGFARGLRATGIPVAGAERSSTSPSQVGWFEEHSLSSVDDTERTIGRAALVFVLAGAHGSFGQKSTADGLLPDVGSTTTP
jgi:hypothetical protein